MLPTEITSVADAKLVEPPDFYHIVSEGVVGGGDMDHPLFHPFVLGYPKDIMHDELMGKYGTLNDGCAGVTAMDD